MGEIADGILNGDFDEQTGEYIGPGDGYPRSINQGARNKGKKTKIFNIVNDKKLLSKNNIEFRELNGGYHLQVKKVLNIYPSTGKYYNSETGEKGFYLDVVKLVAAEFKKVKQFAPGEIVKALKGFKNISEAIQYFENKQ